MESHKYIKQKKDAFVSCSFDLRDKKVVDCIIGGLKSYFNFIKAECPEAKELKEKIIPGIMGSSVFCVILTKKYDAIDGKGNRVNLSSSWIYSEIGAAMALNKENIIVFIEEGIKDLGMLSQSYNYVSFNRQKIESNDKKYIKKILKDIKNYANSVYKNLNLAQEIYKIINLSANLVVYKDGHAIEKYDVLLKTLSDNFNKKKVRFFLERCAFKDTNLRAFMPEISKGTDKQRFTGKTFYARVLSPIHIFINEFESIKEETNENSIGLYLHFKSDGGYIHKETEIMYAWEWSCDRAYPFKKEQLKDGSLKENLAYAEWTLDLSADYGNLDATISFEIGYKLEKFPFIEIYDGETDEIVDTILPSEKEDDLNYTRYKFKIPNIKANRKCVVKWIPQ